MKLSLVFDILCKHFQRVMTHLHGHLIQPLNWDTSVSPQLDFCSIEHLFKRFAADFYDIIGHSVFDAHCESCFNLQPKFVYSLKIILKATHCWAIMS